MFVTTDTFDVLDKNTASWQWKVLIPLEANERLRRNMTLQLESFFVNRMEYFLHKKDNYVGQFS